MKHDTLHRMLIQKFADAIATVAQTPPNQIDPAVRPATDPKFGDYQCNAAMQLARPLKAKPRDIAQRIKEAAEPLLADIVARMEIAGPGFLNIHLKNDFLARYLGQIPAPPADQPDTSVSPTSAVDRVGLQPVENPIRVAIDYSQPNIAKQMHVGHLRSTIIGDAFARVLAFEGHDVVRQNHIGDWGTQFGLLIRWYREHPLPTPATHDDVLEAIENDYKAAHARDQEDPQFATEARQAVTMLQAGDPQAREIWEKICTQSWNAFTNIYERLGALLTREDVRGESFYNDLLAPTVAELRDKLPPLTTADKTRATGQPAAEVRDDQGAVCVFMYDEKGDPLFKNPDGQILPMIIQKSDGAYLYATTDLAAIHYRLHDLNARRVIYVTDARQKLHFEMWMACARAAGWFGPDVNVQHVTFGSVLGPSRKPLKTREGKNIKLRELLDEAERRAAQLLEDRDKENGESGIHLSDEEKQLVAHRVGVGAVKYADLRNDRTADYVFSWDKMLALQGNTAPYMMYAYARIRSIYRKAAERFGSPDIYAPDVVLTLTQPAERALALRLARTREAIDVVASDLTPHTLCTYLYDLASDFMRFYESCPVLAAPDDARLSRMRLCDLTARTLKLGLWLLGIDVVERM